MMLRSFSFILYSYIFFYDLGTGKSYIGVCLVLALDVIRRKAEADGHVVGPILVLSYKNHALDEFLNDIIVSYNASNPSHRRLVPGMMIRTGKPDIESLTPFTERFSPSEIRAQDELNLRLQTQRFIRDLAKKWLEHARLIDSVAFIEVII